ncbi:MAG: tetratricopeptide repeat protein [Flavobacteriales bacterium]|nr:tetratricopeptide repeat protein [Flavobacteriales bacterium]
MKKFLAITNAELTNRNYWVVLLSLGLILFLYYGETIQNGYNLDDEIIYTDNLKTINGLENVREIFTKNSFEFEDFKFGYRPIVLLSFAIENHFFGLNAKASHVINLLLYLLSTYLFFRVITSLFPQEKAKLSYFTVFLFLILPIHSEVVNNVKCRDELLMLIFGLLATYYWIKGTEKPYKFILSILFLYVSILSKKSAFIFLGIIPLVSYFSVEGNWKKALKTFLMMIIPVILFRLTMRIIKKGKGSRVYSAFENPLYESEMLFNKTVMILESTWFYLKNMLFPTQFVSYYGLNTVEINEFGLGSILAILFILLLSYIALRGLKSKKIYAFGVFIILGGIFPFINLVMPMVGVVAERFVTIASLGLCLFVVFGVKELLLRQNKRKWENYAFAGLMIYAIAYLPAIKARNGEWNTELKLLEADVVKEPDSFQINYMLASKYFFQLPEVKDAGRRTVLAKKSLDLYNKTLEIIPTREVYNERGTLFYKVYGNDKEAEKSYLKALELDHNYKTVYYNLGLMYHDKGQTKKSIKNLIELVKRDKDQLKAYYLLTKQLSQIKKYQEALKWANYSLKHNPNNAELTINKANVFYSAGDLNNASIFYNKVLRDLDPNDVTAKEMLKRMKAQSPK